MVQQQRQQQLHVAAAAARRQCLDAPALCPGITSCAPTTHSQRLPPLRAKKAKGKGGGKGGKTSSDDDDDDDGGRPSSSAASSSASGSDDVNLDAVAAEAEADLEARMQKAVNVVADNFNTMRTGRANPAILDRVQVDYYGALTPLKALASVAVPDASTLLISPFDRAALKDIEKAINASDLGLNPSNDGEKIRLSIPQMTQERRKELSKKVAKMGEDGKVAVRNIRKDILKRLDRYEWPKDTKKALEDSVQKTTDGFVKRVDEMVKAKSDDIMKV